mgnify:CR=1 FL=1
MMFTYTRPTQIRPEGAGKLVALAGTRCRPLRPSCTMSALGRLDTERQFGNIILKTGAPGSSSGGPSARTS